MPHERIAAISGMKPAEAMRGSQFEHTPHHTAHGRPLDDEEFREFLKEEQKEGMHPSLKGKHF